MTNVSRMDRELVYERDQYRCAACGGVSPLTIQHRANRGMGGNPSGSKNSLANLLTMCAFCNQLLEQSGKFALEGVEHGWKIRSWDAPQEIPVFYAWAQEWRRLSDNGEAVLDHEVSI